MATSRDWCAESRLTGYWKGISSYSGPAGREMRGWKVIVVNENLCVEGEFVLQSPGLIVSVGTKR